MKIAMIYPHPDSEKGISAYSLNLIDNLKKQDVDIEGITFMQGKPTTLFNKIFKLSEYEVIHVQHEYNLLGWFGLPYFILLAYLRLFKKNKLVVTMHNVLSQQEKFKSGKIKTFLRKLLYFSQNKFIDLCSDKIIVHCKSFKEILKKEYGISEEKIEVLPHAIIEDLKTLSKAQARKELKLSGNVYLIIGSFVPDHGADVIISQADKIGKTILIVTNPNLGNDRSPERIKSFLEMNKDLVKENHFEKFVRFDLGFVPYKTWWKYFSACDLILLPYRGGIGSGIFADAMAMKKPIVASNNNYFQEFAGDYGCLKIAKTDADFPKKIKEAMDPQNYKNMEKECERYFNENGLTPISKKYKKLYTSLEK